MDNTCFYSEPSISLTLMWNEWSQHENPRAHVDWCLAFRNAALPNKALEACAHILQQMLCSFVHQQFLHMFPFVSFSPNRKLFWVVIDFILWKANNFRIFKLKGTWGPLFQTLILRTRTITYRKLKTSKLQIKCSFLTTFSYLLKQACTQRGQIAHNPRWLTFGIFNSVSREEICIPQEKPGQTSCIPFLFVPIIKPQP